MTAAPVADVWEGMDWSPYFRVHILNGAVPVGALAVVAVVAAAGVAQRRTRRTYAWPTAPAALPSEMTRVVYAEDVMVAQEAAELVDETVPPTYGSAKHRSLQDLVDVACALLLFITHIVGALGGTNFEWERSWTVYWGVGSLLAIYTYAHTERHIVAKLAFSFVYFLVMLSNVRTALLRQDEEHAAMALAAMQLGCATLLIIGKVIVPQEAELPAVLLAVRAHADTVHADTAHADTAHADTARAPADAPAEARPPEEYTSLFSYVTFFFMFPFLWRHRNRPVTAASVPPLLLRYRAAAVLAIERATRRAGRHGILHRVLRAFAPQLAVDLVLSLCSTLAEFSAIALFSQLLGFVAARDVAKAQHTPLPPLHLGVALAVGHFVFATTAFVCSLNAYQMGRRVATQMRALLVGDLMSKVLRRRVHDDTRAAGAATDGHISSLLSVDVYRLDALVCSIHQPVVEYPLKIVLSIVMLYRVLGVASFAGVAIMLVLMPLQAFLSKRMLRVQERILRATDARLDLAGEVLACIKTVKFFAWEAPFLARMTAARDRELRMLRRNNTISILYNVIFVGMPMLVTLVTFTVYTVLLARPLTAQTAFTALAVFVTLRVPLSEFPETVMVILSALVSVRRLNEFLAAPDTEKYEQLGRPEASGTREAREPHAETAELHAEAREPALASPDAPAASPAYIGFVHASFAYAAQPLSLRSAPAAPFQLAALHCRFPTGRMSIVVGPVGAGKTSLLLALLGELHLLHGTIHMPCAMTRPAAPMPLSDTTAYCAQNPWLLGTTVRENILFGAAYDDERYRAVVAACALEADLAAFEFHDATEVGEKGTALSGGQKARIAVARAFYSSARYIFIDDALSAVDAHTARHLVERCFQGELAHGRTIVLVTHAVSLVLPVAAYAVVLDAGRVAAQGAPAALRTSGDLPAATPMEPWRADAEDEGQPAHWALAEKQRRRKHADEHAEKTGRNVTGWQMYRVYVTSAARRAATSAALWVVLVALYASVRSADVASNAWLQRWARAFDQSTAPRGAAHETWYYLRHYMGAVLAFVLLSTARDVMQYRIALSASRLLYARMIAALMYARPRFYDTTPIGRIMNRLSRDTETMDLEITPSLRMLVEAVVSLVAILAVICWAAPVFVLFAAVLAVVYFGIGWLYLGSSRDLKRLESVQRSPLFTLLGETLAGTVTVRAYADMHQVLQRCIAYVDRANQAFLYLWSENRWVSIWVDFIGACVTFITALLLLLNGSDAALVGFTLSYAQLIVSVLLRFVRRYTTTEVNLNAVERIQEYVAIPQESRGGTPPPAHWPTDRGVIRVTDLAVRYAPEFPPALNGVTFDIRPGEMIGIVGRTGSGKSTLSLSFFRFLEAERGSIVIDGVDIATVPLEHLRTQLTIIPQDSQLFRGTVRSNLDPFGTCDDADMWFALQRCQLASAPASAQPGAVATLDDFVEQGGANFSAGQRQLLSLARGLLKLRNSRILILDESTANLDSASDALIQKTIREQMAPGTTILTVAHRLRTIIDYDRILVLDKGRVVEYDTPACLLRDRASVFFRLCEGSGELQELQDMVDAPRAWPMQR
ncbi:hypothetical protein MSPP1_000250 [Malassezia sp. CBS 17886]|nr:hypothetical protein MSPP1_000250 [Malassezia sp. CBS 17886]